MMKQLAEVLSVWHARCNRLLPDRFRVVSASPAAPAGHSASVLAATLPPVEPMEEAAIPNALQGTLRRILQDEKFREGSLVEAMQALTKAATEIPDADRARDVYGRVERRRPGFRLRFTTSSWAALSRARTFYRRHFEVMRPTG